MIRRGIFLSAAVATIAVGLISCSRRDETPSASAVSQGAAPGAPGATSPVQWAPWAEPTQHAFTVELPVGWPAQGGLQKLSTGEIRPWLRAAAPDGSAEIFIGDPEIPDFTPPTTALADAGLVEGKVFMPGQGRALTVSPYHEGQAFAAEWGQGRLGAHCDGVTPTAGQSLPDLGAAIAAAEGPQPAQTTVKAGEARFRCTYHGRAATARVIAVTGLDARGPFEIWNVRVAAGVIGAPAADGLPATALAHALRSFRPDADWLKRQPGWSGDALRAEPAMLAATADAVDRR